MSLFSMRRHHLQNEANRRVIANDKATHQASIAEGASNLSTATANLVTARVNLRNAQVALLMSQGRTEEAERVSKLTPDEYEAEMVAEVKARQKNRRKRS